MVAVYGRRRIQCARGWRHMGHLGFAEVCKVRSHARHNTWLHAKAPGAVGCRECAFIPGAGSMSAKSSRQTQHVSGSGAAARGRWAWLGPVSPHLFFSVHIAARVVARSAHGRPACGVAADSQASPCALTVTHECLIAPYVSAPSSPASVSTIGAGVRTCSGVPTGARRWRRAISRITSLDTFWRSASSAGAAASYWRVAVSSNVPSPPVTATTHFPDWERG